MSGTVLPRAGSWTAAGSRTDCAFQVGGFDWLPKVKAFIVEVLNMRSLIRWSGMEGITLGTGYQHIEINSSSKVTNSYVYPSQSLLIYTLHQLSSAASEGKSDLITVHSNIR